MNGTATYATGEQVHTLQYTTVQHRIVAKTTLEMLGTGPEQYQIASDVYDALLRSSVREDIDDGNMKRVAKELLADSQFIERDPLVWSVFRPLHSQMIDVYGSLARYSGLPIERVSAELSMFMHGLGEDISVLRYLWHEKTRQILGVNSALSSIFFIGPRVIMIPDGVGDVGQCYLDYAALFPYVSNDPVELRYDSNLGSITSMLIRLSDEVAGEVQRDLVRYGRR